MIRRANRLSIRPRPTLAQRISEIKGRLSQPRRARIEQLSVRPRATWSEKASALVAKARSEGKKPSLKARKGRQGPREPRPGLRIKAMALVFVLAFSVLFLRLWYLQVLQNRIYDKQAVSQAVRLVEVQPVRGEVLARTGQVLVGNRTVEEVTLSRIAARGHPKVISRLAKVLHLSPSLIKSHLNSPEFSPYQPVPIVTNAPLPEVLYLREHQSRFPGVSVTLTSVVKYPFGSLAGQMLGYLAQITPSELKVLSKQGYVQGDLIGQSGVEAQFQSWLRGSPGKTRLEVNPLGQVVGKTAATRPKPGDDVVLALDPSLESFVQKTFAAEVLKLRASIDPGTGKHPKATSGAVVVMDPRNGHVLAMTSYPTYNPSVWIGGISQAAYNALTSPSAHEPLLNRAIQGLYTPGSTFKIATATAALQLGLITPSTVIDDKGTYTIPNCNPAGGACTFHNAGYEALGPITIQTAISASDDIFFYNLGVDFWAQRAKYGETPIQHFAHLYGLGRGTGIDLPGALAGQIDSPKLRQEQHAENPKAFPYPGWYAGDNLEMAFGQGETLITPIELADAYAAFAEDGVRYQPQVALGIVSPSGKLVKSFPPKVESRVPISQITHSVMLKGFEGAITNYLGTAYYTFHNKYPYAELPIAGKTGTATITHHSEPTSLFVAFGPVGNPRYVVAAVVQRAGYGALGAAPIVRDIFEHLISHPVHSTTALAAFKAEPVNGTSASQKPRSSKATIPSAGIPAAGSTPARSATTSFNEKVAVGDAGALGIPGSASGTTQSSEEGGPLRAGWRAALVRGPPA